MGIEIHLSDDYYLTSDKHEFTLVKRLWNANKEEYYYQPQSHFGTLDSALEGYSNLKQKESDATSIEEFGKILSQIRDNIRGVKEALQLNS